MKKIALLLLAQGLLAAGTAYGEVTFRVLNGAEPPSLDPALSEDNASHNILLALFEGLLIYDPKTNDGMPGMAESYTISADGKQYNFKIRKNAMWSDGVAINAIIQKIGIKWSKEGARGQYGIGSAAAQGIGKGKLLVTGTLSSYFSDFSLYDEFKNETGGSIWVTALDSTGMGYVTTRASSPSPAALPACPRDASSSTATCSRRATASRNTSLTPSRATCS